jgi:hypothetical protein
MTWAGNVQFVESCYLLECTTELHTVHEIVYDDDDDDVDTGVGARC